MNSPHFRRPLNTLTRIGLCLLIAASVLYYLVSHQLVPHNGLTDFAQGTLYGLCFASILIGLWRSSRQRPGGTCRAE